MRILAILVLVFGAALAGGTVYFVNKHFDRLNAMNTQPANDTVKVLVAKQTLPYGKRLALEDLQWVEWPRSSVPPGAFTQVKKLFGENGKERRIVLRAIEAGEPILDARITSFGESPRVALSLPEGMRAVSIRIDDVSGVAGFVAPGDRVDILLTRSSNDKLVSSVILTEIKVLAIDQQLNTESSSPKLGRTVTVEVNTRQAQKLAVAQQVGNLSLTLRGFGEETTEVAAPLTADELNDLGVGPKAAPPPTVRVRRGSKVRTERIDGTTDESSSEPEEAPAQASTEGQAAPAASN